MAGKLYSLGGTDVGLMRAKNEDSMFVSDDPVGTLPNLYAVSDGMGGHNAGEVASREAVRHFVGRIRELSYGAEDYLDILVEGVSYANRKVFEMSLSDRRLRGMGTTFSACSIAGGKIYIAHVGDSRVYMSSARGISQLTADHTFVSEMIRAGGLTPEEALIHEKRGVLTRAVGTSPEVQIDASVFELPEACVILLCSDGLTNVLSDSHIQSVLQSGDAEAMVSQLIAGANENGGPDNITAVVIQSRFDEGGVNL